MRRQPRAHGAAGRARPRALQGPRAGRDDGAHAVPADRRAALPAHAAGPRLLLVPARRRRARRRHWHEERLAPRGPAGAGAVRRLDELLPRPRGALAHRTWRRRCASSSSARCCRRASRRSAGTPPRATRCAACASATRRVGRGRTLAVTLAHVELERGEPRPTSCRSRSRGKTATRSACARWRRSRSPRCASRRRSACSPTPSPTRRSAARWSRRSARATSCDRARHAALQRRPRRSRRLAGDAARAAAVRRVRRAEQQHRRHARRAPVPQGLPARCGGRQSGGRDRPLPHRGRALPAQRAGGRHDRVRADDGREATLALLQGYVDNQGDGWRYTLELPRALLRAPRAGAEATGPAGTPTAATSRWCGRSASAPRELHAALARAHGRSRLRSRAVHARRHRRDGRSACGRGDAALDRLEQRKAALPEPAQRGRGAGARAARGAPRAHRRARGATGRRRPRRATTATTTWGRCCWCRTTS